MNLIGSMARAHGFPTLRPREGTGAAERHGQTYAVSKSGDITGPWEQHRPLVRDDSGHGMLFRTFDGELMMVLHRPLENARGKLYEMRLLGHELRVLRQQTDLDGGG